MCLRMVRGQRACGTVSIQQPWNWMKKRKTKKPRRGRSASQLFALSGEKQELRCRTGASHELCDRIALAVPHTKQHYFRPRGIFENVINVRTPFDFKEAGPTRIWPRRSTGMKQHAQFSNLLLRMISQVFHEGRVFRNCHNHVHSPPHSAYRFPHLVRRKNAVKVSWAATSFLGVSRRTRAVVGETANLPAFWGENEQCKSGPNWL